MIHLYKSACFLVILCMYTHFVKAQQPDTWSRAADVKYNNIDGPIARGGAISFSIGQKAYYGTGSRLDDMWEYNPSTNSWTQKASLTGGARTGGVGFSINGKGYAGLGIKDSGRTDMWEYDPALNTWNQKAHFPDAWVITGAKAFVIGNKAYVGGGWHGDSMKNTREFWEFDPHKNTWTAISDFPGNQRNDPTVFTIINKGYLGLGSNANNTFYTDLWEYSPGTDTWTRKKDFPSSGRHGAAAFTLDTSAYVIGGYNGNTLQEMWQYNAPADTWARMKDFAGTGKVYMHTFSTGDKRFAGFGNNGQFNMQDFWEYLPATDTWQQKTSGGGDYRGKGVAFNIGNKAYMGCGFKDVTYLRIKDFWEYTPETNSWSQIADFGGGDRVGAVGFAIGGKGYVGTGYSSSAGFNVKDFWEYDPATNMWTRKADFKGGNRTEAVGFAIGNKGYVGTGNDWGYHKDFWEYDPQTNTWTKKADFAGGTRSAAVGFSINGKGYIGTGTGSAIMQDFWEYDPATDAWKQKSNFGGGKRVRASGFNIGNKGYIGLGESGGQYEKDFWSYEPDTDTWTKIADFAGPQRISTSTFAIGTRGYIANGSGDNGYTIHCWQYASNYTLTVDTIIGAAPFCGSASLTIPFTVTGKFYADNVFSAYLSDKDGNFENGVMIGSIAADTSDTINAALPTHIAAGNKYKIRITSSSPQMWGEAYYKTLPVHGDGPSVDVISDRGNKICSEDSVKFTATTAGLSGTMTYQWLKNGIATGPNNAIYYDNSINDQDEIVCVASGTNLCTATTVDTSDAIKMEVLKVAMQPISAKDSMFCMGDSLTLIAHPSAYHNYVWIKDDTTFIGNNSETFVADTTGSYKVIVSDKNNCTDTSISIKIKSNPLPVVSIVSADTAFCENDSLLLYATSSAGILLYTWKDTATIGSSDSSHIYIHKAGIYSVTVTDTNACTATSDSIIIITNPTPKPIITRSGNALSTGAFANYQWYDGGNKIPGANSQSYMLTQSGIYTVEVVDTNGCIGKSDTLNTTGISTTQHQDVTVYPNPATNTLTVSGCACSADIYNVLGVKVLTTTIKLPREQIYITMLPPGNYVLQLTDMQGNRFATKITKH